MEIVFLGTGSAYPCPHRGASALTLGFGGTGDQWLFDCGEGTQIQAMRSRIKVGKIQRVFISHLHGDHLFGLPGLLCTMGQRGTNADETDCIHIYGPHGLRKFLRISLGLSRSILGFKYACHEINFNAKQYPSDWFEVPTISPETTDPLIASEIMGENIEPNSHGFWSVCTDTINNVEVKAVWLKHATPSLGWIIKEQNQVGKLNMEEAIRLGVPKGPLLGKLKQGIAVTLENGSIVHPSEVIGPDKVGRCLAIMGDSCDSSSLLSRHLDIRGGKIDLLIHETTLESAMEDNAIQKGHSTPKMVAELANKLNMTTSSVLVLTHFSQRYKASGAMQMGDDEGDSVSKLGHEAAAIFHGNVIVAEDFLTVPVPTKCDILEVTNATNILSIA